MSGSSTSRNRRSSLTSARRRSSGSRTAMADERLETGAGGRRQLGGGRQDLVEVLGHDVGDRLAAERGVQDVGRDLGVEGDRQRRATPGSSANAATRTGLTSCPTSGDPGPLERAGAARRRPRRPSAATTRPSGPATASASGVPRRGRGSSASSETPIAGCAASHGSRSVDAVRAADLDPARVDDRGGQRRRQVLGRLEACVPPARPVRRRRRSAGGRPADRVEVEPKLQLAARRPACRRGPAPQPSGRPATRAAGHVAALDDGSQAVASAAAPTRRPSAAAARSASGTRTRGRAGRPCRGRSRRGAPPRGRTRSAGRARSATARGPSGSGRGARAACRAASPGVTSSRRSNSASRSPNSRMSLAAVFSPTPGTPGMLSVGSPLSAL